MLDEQQSLESRLRQFVADASHELRTPVSVILGVTDLWRQGELRSGEARDDVMRRIGQSGARMAGLVEDLLLLARLDEGRSLSSGPVDLSRLIDAVVEDASATHPLRTVCVDAPGPIMVEGEEASLRQVIVNLVTNSLTYTPPTATIIVHAASMGDKVVFEVADSGPGMSPQMRARPSIAFGGQRLAEPVRAVALVFPSSPASSPRTRRGHARIGHQIAALKSAWCCLRPKDMIEAAWISRQQVRDQCSRTRHADDVYGYIDKP